MVCDVKVSGCLCRGQRAKFADWSSPFTKNSWDQTQVFRLLWRALYLSSVSLVPRPDSVSPDHCTGKHDTPTSRTDSVIIIAIILGRRRRASLHNECKWIFVKEGYVAEMRLRSQSS